MRISLGLVMVSFFLGYIFIRALFPGKDEMDGIETVALSFGLRFAVVPLIGLGLNYTIGGIRLTPVVLSLTIFTVVMAAAAHLRRLSLPLDDSSWSNSREDWILSEKRSSPMRRADWKEP